jgi:outer membrane protein insertion porin family
LRKLCVHTALYRSTGTLVWMLAAATGFAQVVDLEHRPVSDVRIEGLKQASEQLVRNQIRTSKGDPYSGAIIQEDIVRVTHLGRFSTVVSRAEPQPDGSIVVVFQVTEQAVVADVLFAGNKQLSDQELGKLVLLRVGDRVDPFLIDRGIQQIKAAYEQRGYYNTDVSIDEERIESESILLFLVREGPRPRILDMRFDGNRSFTSKQLRSKVRSKTYFPIFQKGQLSRERLTLDAARIRDFYRDRGYLDAEADRIIDVSPNEQDATVTFIIKEGRRYTVRAIVVEGNHIFSTPQIMARMPLKAGDVFSAERVKKSREALFDMYGKLGHLETKVAIQRLFDERQPTVDVTVVIDEGIAYLVGKVTVQGNDLTRQKVILRQVRGIRPGRTYDRSGLEKTRQRLAPSSLFSEARVTILGDEEDKVRDALIEVQEKNTGSISFGAGISSDAGIAGAIDLIQRNFDIGDFPESLSEFISGKAFRGAGQFCSIRVQPGNERSLYSVSFKEPYIFDSDYFLDTNAFFFDREREDFDEQRIGGRVGLGQRFGDIYSASITSRFENVDIRNIDVGAPVDAFAVEGQSGLTSIGLNLSRNTTDNSIFPTKGSRLRAGIERIGAFGGDFDFFKGSAAFRKFWTLAEDFFGRRTVFSVRTEVGHIFNAGDRTVVALDGLDGTPLTPANISEAPLFERFYAGGHRTFRGFEFRGAGPRGIIAGGPRAATAGNDPVGGDFLFLLGAEYNFPIYQQIVRGVFFVDSGTIREDIGFDEYRVSVGTGLRLQIPFLGSAPFAFDVALPIVKEDGDEEQFFSFDLAIPF